MKKHPNVWHFIINLRKIVTWAQDDYEYVKETGCVPERYKHAEDSHRSKRIQKFTRQYEHGSMNIENFLNAMSHQNHKIYGDVMFSKTAFI